MKFSIIAIQRKWAAFKSYWLTCLCASLIVTAPNLSYAQESTKDQDLALLDAEIQSIMHQHKVASVAFAVMSKGHAPHIRTYGVANQEVGTKATINTQYRIASASKMIVSIAIMQLVEAGKLTLDDKLALLLPDFKFSNKWSKTHPLQLKHILESTTGWDGTSLQEFAYNNSPPLDLAASLTFTSKIRESRWPPGTRHAYNNAPAAVAALIVEKTTGMSFYSYAQLRIFTPLGIQNATYSKPNKNSATGYKNSLPVEHKALLFRPAGGLSLSIEDMSKLLELFVNKGYATATNGALLTPQSIARMEHSHTTNVGEFPAGYGLFNFARYYDGIRYRGHDGALPGWLSELSYSPKQEIGFVVLQNAEHGQSFRAIVNAITTHLAKDFLPESSQKTDIPDKWTKMSGYYRYQNPRLEKRFFLERLVSTYKLEIHADKAVLSSVFPPGWRRELTYKGQNTWQNDKAEAVMKLGSDPIAGEVLHYGDRVFAPVSTINAWADKFILVLWVLVLTTMLFHSLIWPLQHLRGKLFSEVNVKDKQNALRFYMGMSLATWSFVLFIIFLALGFVSPIERFGNVGFYSLGLFFSSLLIVITTAWAIWKLFSIRKSTSSKFLYWYSVIYIFLQILVVGYLLNHDVIGILVWT